MKINIAIHDSCDHMICEEEEREAINYFDRDGVYIIEVEMLFKNENRINIRFGLSNGYCVSYQKGLDKFDNVFHRIEIEDDESMVIYTKKSKKYENMISVGWKTITEGLLARTFEIIENL